MRRVATAQRLVGIISTGLLLFVLACPNVQSSGEIVAESGAAKDIQAAVNIASSGADVFVPAGTWNFVNIDEPITTVVVPAGINIFGAPTERTSGLPEPEFGMSPNNQVVEWKTILRIPWNAPAALCFRFTGTSNPDKPSRFSDIEMIGYRSIDSTAEPLYGSVNMECVANYRIDHCRFENMAGGIGALGTGVHSWEPITSYGVTDHCYLVNTHGYAAPYPGTCGYGIHMTRGYGDYWEDNISLVLGQYTDYTNFIEDCYFEKWRHVTAANSGAHYVFRRNTIKDDFGYGSLDGHGWFQSRCLNPQHGSIANPPGMFKDGQWICGAEVVGNPDGICGEILGEGVFVITQVGTRAIEIYDCEIIDAIQSGWATFIRGGGGVAFHNRVGGGTYISFIYMSNEARAEGSKCWSKDWWVWNNTLLPGCADIITYDPEGIILEGREYFRHAPDTFNYVPYPYPHPLAIGEPVEPEPKEPPTGGYEVILVIVAVMVVVVVFARSRRWF